MPTYPKGIEIVTGIIVENDQKEIFLTRSKYWQNKYVLPGGIIMPGETFFKATERKILEDLNLIVQPIAIYNSGELIDSKDFKRPAHYIYFNIYSKVVKGILKIDTAKHFDAIWLRPKEALNLDLAESFDHSIQKFIDYLN